MIPPCSVILFACVALLNSLPHVALAGQAQPSKPEYSVIAPLAPRSLLLDGASLDRRVVVAGGRGHILITEAPFQSWQQIRVPTRATLTGVFFYDRTLGWAVGHDQVILRTSDSGQSWQRVYCRPHEYRPLLDVWFQDTKNGFAIGAYGLFLETSDGGNTWAARQISEDDFHLNHITSSATGRLYMAAEAGTIYRSDDAGKTWTSLPSPYDGSFFGTLPLHDDTLLLFGLRGHLFRSEDAGKTWVEVETATEAMLTSGLVLDDGTIIIAGLAGTVLVSRDGGQSFTLHQQSDRQGIAALVQAADGSVILIGEFGVKKLPASAYTLGENGSPGDYPAA